MWGGREPEVIRRDMFSSPPQNSPLFRERDENEFYRILNERLCTVNKEDWRK